MNPINSAIEINAATVLELRRATGLGQRLFWRGVAVSSGAGCSYETGRVSIPVTVRRLIFLHYVVGIPTDLTLADAQGHGTLCQSLKSAREARRAVADAAAQIERGLQGLNAFKG